jgi:hypothetical protein
MAFMPRKIPGAKHPSFPEKKIPRRQPMKSIVQVNDPMEENAYKRFRTDIIRKYDRPVKGIVPQKTRTPPLAQQAIVPPRKPVFAQPPKPVGRREVPFVGKKRPRRKGVF